MKPYCELAAKHPFSETSQSCVSTTATLSHRFKSSPSIPGNLAVPGAAGYMMMAGHFSENLVSSGDLKRGRRTESTPPTWSPCSRPFAILPVSAVSDAQKLATGNFLHVRARAFYVTFCTTQKVTSRFPCRELRGFPNLESAHPNNTLPRTKLNPLPLCLLETWSPCSRPFAILPVSAVSDAQKLATGNFLHVRAATFFLLFVKYKK